MAKPNTAAYKTFDDITGRLDEIVTQVRDKDVSLERSLDLFDEAIALGSKAVDMVDTTDFTAEEEAKLQESERDAAEGEKAAEEPMEDASEATDGVSASDEEPKA
jgi:exonuclease VII small subunit